MRIATIDSFELCDIAVPLRRLASNAKQFDAARWRKLLELVEFLHSQGPHPQALGQVLGRELWLSLSSSDIVVRVWVDSRDYAPLVDGLPQMHYRFQIQHPEKNVSQDARAHTVEEADRIIRDAFGWS